MAKLTAEMKEVVEATKVAVLATATKDGKPNAVPITFTKVISDDEILLVDNYMLKTRQNLEENPFAVVSAWASGKGGYQFKGEAIVETSGKNFEDGYNWVKSVADRLTPKAVVIVKVSEVYVTSGGPDAGKRVA